MSKRKADFGTPEKENKCPKMSDTPSAVRSYRDEWKNGHPWLRNDAKSKAMFCDYCIKSQRSNIFTKGCSVLKKESVTKHATPKGKKHFNILN